MVVHQVVCGCGGGWAGDCRQVRVLAARPCHAVGRMHVHAGMEYGVLCRQCRGMPRQNASGDGQHKQATHTYLTKAEKAAHFLYIPPGGMYGKKNG